jgi:hypothetical protein
MFAKGSWTKVPIDIDGSDPHLCANACKWHDNFSKRLDNVCGMAYA